MKIKTNILQDMLTKVCKCASNNNLVPITSLLGIEVKDNKLILTSTDGNNQLEVNQDIDISENFYTIVNIEKFSKLVSKTTKEYIELINNENYLLIKGNGQNKIELAINEEGELVKFSDVDVYGDYEVIDLVKLQNAIKYAKTSVLKPLDIPVLTGYYIGDSILTTNRQMVCQINEKLISKPILIYPETAELLLIINEKDIHFKESNGLMIFETNKYRLKARQLQDINDYPVKQLSNLLALDYNSNICVDKKELLNILDRTSIFVKKQDDNIINLKFNKEKLIIQSKEADSIENIEFLEANNAVNLDCLIDIEMFKTHIKALQKDIINIHYGSQKSIKLVEDTVDLVIALEN